MNKSDLVEIWKAFGQLFGRNLKEILLMRIWIRVYRRQRRSPGGNHHYIAAKIKVFSKEG